MARSQQVEVGASIHLALEGLQFVDLAFCLPVGPRLAKGSQNGILVGVQTTGEGCEKAASGLAQPFFEIIVFAVSDHVGEAPGQGAGCGKIRNGGFDPGHGDSVGPREMIARRCHHAGNPARRRASARRGVGRRFRAPLSCRPLADDAQASPEPLCAKTASQFGAIPATAFPFPREPGQPRLETALAYPATPTRSTPVAEAARRTGRIET